MGKYQESAVVQRYGKTPSSDEEIAKYLQALKVIIGADGEVAEEEMNVLRKGMKRLGASEDLVKMIEGFNISGVKLETVLPSLTPGGKRARYLLKDAIEIARADGTYAQGEKDAVAKAADLLGVSQETRKAIESLVELEHASKHLRKAIFGK